VTNHELAVAAAGRFDHLVGIFAAERDGLFAEDMFSISQCAKDILAVEVSRQADVCHIKLNGACGLAVGRENRTRQTGSFEFTAQVLPAGIHHRDYAGIAKLGVNASMGFSHKTETQQGDVDGFIHGKAS
jgi:hypothetical protein